VQFGAGQGLTITMNDDGSGQPYRLAWDEGTSRIVTTEPDGHLREHGFAHYFGLNDLVVADGNGRTDLALRSDIKADSRLLANVVMTRDGNGDLVVGGVGDTSGLQRLAAALDKEAATVARGGLPGASTTVSRYISDMTALAAARSAQAQNREAADRAIVEDLEFRKGAVSGVNLDEELAKLVLYQQAYSVSARLISITNDMFGELVNMVR
jgi:flagellar hook-associated protein 1